MNLLVKFPYFVNVREHDATSNRLHSISVKINTIERLIKVK